MGYQERIEIVYKQQDLVTSEGREPRFLAVHLLPIGPVQYQVTCFGPEYTIDQLKALDVGDVSADQPNTKDYTPNLDNPATEQ